MADIETTVSAIAFGTQSRAPGPCLGLYLSPDTIYLSECHADAIGKIVVDHLVRIPIPTDARSAPGTATMSTEFLSDPAKVGGAVRHVISQLKWNSKRVRVTLSHHLGLMRYFTMPAMDRRYLHTAVPLEAKKYIPIPFDTLAYDFQTIPVSADAQGKPRIGVLITVTQKNNLANIRGLLASLGLQLDGLEVAPCSLLRLWKAIDPPRGPEPFAHVHIDGGNVRVAIFDKGYPIFFREVFLGADAALSDLRKIDLSGCLAFVRKQLGVSGLSHVRISGTTPSLADLRTAFAGEAGVEAVVQNTPKLLSVKSGDWGGYAALGASAHSQISTPVTLDLAATDRITEDDRVAARDILFAGGGLALVLAAAGLFQAATLHFRSGELKRYRVDPVIAAAFKGLPPLEIDNRLREMQSQADQLGSLSGDASRPKTSALLREIVSVMPENVWLETFTVSNPISMKSRAAMSINLAGRVQDASATSEQTLAFAFKENILKNPTLGKLFEAQISLQKSGDGEARGGDVQQEGRTRFTLEMKPKGRR